MLYHLPGKGFPSFSVWSISRRVSAHIPFTAQTSQVESVSSCLKLLVRVMIQLLSIYHLLLSRNFSGSFSSAISMKCPYICFALLKIICIWKDIPHPHRPISISASKCVRPFRFHNFELLTPAFWVPGIAVHSTCHQALHTEITSSSLQLKEHHFKVLLYVSSESLLS